jgi:hypothetical protein
MAEIDDIAVALRRLTHPERDSGAVVEDNPVSELMRQAVAFIERWNAKLNEREDGAAPKRTKNVAPDDTGQVVITLLFDTRVLARIDAAAKHLGISRADWLHFAVGERLKGR